MPIRFEWDPKKAASNLARHRVSFEEAATAFGDPDSVTIADPEHSLREDRFILLGMSGPGRLVVTVFTEIGSTIRIISARPATKREARQYTE